MSRAGDLHAAWRNLPFADLAAIAGAGRTMILAPHPDDESLGCGGLIAELCRCGRKPLVVILTDGTGSHAAYAGRWPAALRDVRESEAVLALRRLGLTDRNAVVFLRLRDAAAPHGGAAFGAAVDRLVCMAAGCRTVCATWGNDPHCDHEAADLMARALAARAGLRHIAYPVWGWTLPPDADIPKGAVRGWRLDITQALAAKQSAIAAHRSQHGVTPDGFSAGFALPDELLRVAAQPFEVFLAP